MSETLQKRARGAITSASLKTKRLNAETVTTIATSFLKRIGHKSGIKPKRVSLEEGIYIIEVEMKKLLAIVRVNAETHEIKEYEIQPKGEEASFVSFSPKIIAVVFGISAVVYVALYFIFQIFGF
ncbi:hypothetical protein KAU93_05270 [Candidatus Bathyarchaeota archaeon]|nr:hypothetical protein [Candidatus Bathyarchaeota archaeon]